MVIGKKSLGQHWLTDKVTLDYIVDQAQLESEDTVLEIGPGTGNLTAKLLATGIKVVAVEKDESLAAALPSRPNLQINTADILTYDLSKLPSYYKVVANIPYYLTSHLLKQLSTSTNPPARMVLLVQKEVADRLCAKPGAMSILAVSVQLYYDCKLGHVVPAKLFQPPPKVDSQVVILDRREKPLFNEFDTAKFFKVVKAGFSEKRKMLRSSLAGGLGINKNIADSLLSKSGIDGNRRAQELSLTDWNMLSQQLP